MGRKYTVSYASQSCAWEQEVDSADKARYLVEDMRHERYPHVTVYDHALGDIVFFKPALSMPEVDLLFTGDMRTTNRHAFQ